MFHMIRGFFVLPIVVAGVELGIRYAVLLYALRSSVQQRVDRAAQQLADDVKSIVLDAGGPTEAQTVYPILDRNCDGPPTPLPGRPGRSSINFALVPTMG